MFAGYNYLYIEGYLLQDHDLMLRAVQLAKEAGVVLTKAGATYPYGKDEADSNIRIAPSYPNLDELETAMKIFTLCVKIAGMENILETKYNH